MFFRSIRFKVLVWYVIFLTITLLSFSFIVYGSFKKNLFDRLDDLLVSRADGIAESVSMYYRAMKLSDNEKFSDIASGWVNEKNKDQEAMSVFTQILDQKGESVISSKRMPRVESIDKDDLEDVLNGDDDLDTVGGNYPDGRRARFRVYYKPVYEGSEVRNIIQAVAPVSLVSMALKDLRLILFILLPVTIILAGIPSILLVRLTLKPVDSMINTLRQITAENLKLKIHLPETKDEIKKLATTFNDMIERLDRSFTSQQKFIQNISHELKAPMNILKNELGAAIENNDSEEECKAVIFKALVKVNDIFRMIDDLVTLSSFDNDDVALEIRKIDASEIIGHVIGDMKLSAEKKDIDLLFHSQAPLIIDGDEKKLRRMVTSLLDNAIKYTYRKGRIAVAAIKDGVNIKITVSDTGVGIPEDEKAYIFDRFYKVDKTGNSKDGFGLGLSCAKSVAEAHKGTIDVKSEFGKGSTFTVTLPLSYPA